MAAPDPTEIQALYERGEAAGMTRDEIDALAVPHISRMGGASSLRQARSRGELRTIAGVIADEISRRSPAPQRSRRSGSPAAAARAAGRRHGVDGEVWD